MSAKPETALPETAPMTDARLYHLRKRALGRYLGAVEADELFAEIDRLRAATVSAGRLRAAAERIDPMLQRLASKTSFVPPAGGAVAEIYARIEETREVLAILRAALSAEEG